MTLTLADFTRPGLIVPHLQSRDATSAIHELSLALQREGCVPDWLPFYHEVLNREFLVSTDMEAGIALPHARLAGLRELTFAFGRSDTPFTWGPRNAGPVRLVFLLAVPAADSAHYLALVSGLARLSKNAALLDAVNGAADGAAIMSAFRQVTLPADLMPATQASAGFH